MNRCKSLIVVVAAACSFAVGCGGDESGPGFDVPECGDREVVIEGTIGEEELAPVSETWNQFTFEDVVGTTSGRLRINFPTNDSIFLEWNEPLTAGGRADVRGFVDFRDVNGPRLGNCETGSFSGEIYAPDGDEPGAFLLRDLRDSMPYCGNLPVGGEIRGCFARPPAEPEPTAL